VLRALSCTIDREVPLHDEPIRHLRVAIAGGGFSGLGTAIKLKELGEHDFLIFERASRVGGVWRDNTYPGCACDVPSHLYSFSFARNPDWTHSFSRQWEIWAYLEQCADRFGLRPHLRFDQGVLEATWDDDAQRWQLVTTGGCFTADVFVAAVGALSEPGIPKLPGLTSFEGKTFHSARWDHTYDLAGKQVAVVGTGASAIQFVPVIQPEVKELTIFQRTAPWVVPRRDRAFRETERERLRHSEALQWLVRSGIYSIRELGAVAFFHPRIARLVQKLAERHLRRSVKDPVLRAKLTPNYTIGCKRILISDDYYPAITQPNVEVVTHEVTRVTATGVVASDGQERPVDAIIFGTGFQIQDYPFGKVVRGRTGKTLAETWTTTMTAHLGTTVAGFPNLFLLQGPNTGLGHTSVIVMIEAQIDHVLNAIRHLRSTGATSVEPTEQAQSAFVAKIDHDMEGTVWTAGGCASWYLDRQGRNSTLWPSFTFAFRQRVAPFDPAEYRTRMPHGRADRAIEGAATRVAFKVARGLLQLPASVQRRLAGGGRVKRDGFELDAALQLLLKIDEKIAGAWPEDAHRLRAERDKAAMQFRGPLPYVPGVKDLEVDGASGPLRARHYRPYEKDSPLLVYFHGGGFVFGNVETHDPGCRLLCQHGKMNVLSIEYRLVPENRFPDAILDAQAAVKWALAHAKELGADPTKVGVGGDSAGANLSAVVSLLSKEGGPRPAFQLLIYPPTDRSRAHASVDSLADGFMLTRDAIAWFHGEYATKAGGDVKDLRISPLLAPDFVGLPPALVVTAGFDPLRDEGLAYADALEKAGVRVVRKQYDTLIHGFFNLTGLHEPSAKAVSEVGRLLRGLVTDEKADR